MSLNTDTLDLLYEMDLVGLPEKQRWLTPEPEEVNDRYAVLGEEVLGDYVERRFGGCWPELGDALESYDWNAGAPVYIVDLFADPTEALMDVKLTASVNARRTLKHPGGGPLL